MKNIPLKYFLPLVLLLLPVTIIAQLYTPVTITGFNHDVVAETGTSSLTTTTSALDGVAQSNKVMYTVSFGINNQFDGGGIPDNGTITNAAGTYQLMPYNGSNALIVQRNQNADLTLTTPAKFSGLRVLCFATEGIAQVNVKLFFTDGSITNLITNYFLDDWFNGTSNLVLSGFGRCTRATPASGADAFPNNPRLYFMDVPMTCADRQKSLQKINFSNVTTAGSNAPFPNAVFFALSGKAFTQNITTSTTNGTCTTNGSATVTVTGLPAVTSIVWVTTPVQTGPTVSLPPGPYTVSITDASLCVTNLPIVIPLTNTQIFNLPNPPASICSGTSFTPNLVSNSTSYLWTPPTGVSNTGIANPVLSPTVTTSYTVTATLGYCIHVLSPYIVNVAPAATMSPLNPVTICSGSSFTPSPVSNATTYSWSPTTGVSNPAILNPVLSPTTTTLYTLTGTLGACTVSRTLLVNVLQGVTVNAGSDVSIFSGSSVQLQGTGSAGTYLWTPSTGLSSTNVLNPVASPATTTTYTLLITNPNGCSNTDNVIVTVIPYCVKPLNAFSPNGDGINDKWIVTNGGTCTKNIRVIVFNRYGNVVYQSEDYKNNWDGTYKGKPLPDATYYYTIRFILVNNDEINLNGDLTILR